MMTDVDMKAWEADARQWDADLQKFALDSYHDARDDNLKRAMLTDDVAAKATLKEERAEERAFAENMRQLKELLAGRRS
jgi:hypothetical protein